MELIILGGACFLFGYIVGVMMKVGSNGCIECAIREQTVDQSGAQAGGDIVGGNKITKGE